MYRFARHYLFWLALLFGVLYVPLNPIAQTLNTWQTELTLYILKPLIAPTPIQEIDILISPRYKIIITQACNGMIPTLMIAAAILAFPSSLRIKLLWLLLSYVVFVVANAVRLVWVVYAVSLKGGSDNFYWAHDIVGNMLLIIVGMTLFYLYLNHATKK